MRYLILVLSLWLAGCETTPSIPEAIDASGDAQTLEDGTAPYIHIAEPFDANDFRGRFAMKGPNKQVSIAESPDPSRPGPVLKVQIPAGSHLGANFSWRFQDHPPGEPERLYARYFVYFEPGWDSGRGGKLPGPAGRYGKAGWGGRPAKGTNGWSARMGFKKGLSDTSTQLMYYAYVMDTGKRYGRNINWDRASGLLGFDSVGDLEFGRWYCVESFIHLNDPDGANGRLTGWIDGALAMDEKGLRFRTTPELRIEEYWFNVFWGGKGRPKKRLVVYFDDLLLADTRLGCAAAQG